MGIGIVSFVGVSAGDPAGCEARVSARIADADIVVTDDNGAGVGGLAELARRGLRVVRSVIGDPLERSDVVDEMRAVAESGARFEVVPGLGASQTAGAFAGVIGRAFRAKASSAALAILGDAPETSISVVVAAGTPMQRVIVTTVQRASEALNGLADESVVVAFGVPDERLRWFERRPLFGKRILVTRPRRQADLTAKLLRELGALPVLVPMIEIAPPSDPEPLARALANLRLGTYSWVAFTSANGVEETWRALDASAGDARAFGSVRLAAIGPATAHALSSHGLAADVVAKEYRGEGLATDLLDALSSLPGRVLLLRAAKARDVLPRMLMDAGYSVDVVVAYETRAAVDGSLSDLADSLAYGHVDGVLFTSSSTVDGLCDALGNRATELLSRVRVASIGPVTTQTATARGLRVDVTAREYTVPGLIRALEHSYDIADL